MNAALQPCLRTQSGARVPLAGISATGRLDGLLFELTVEQHYRNTSGSAVETVYTFPLPLNAVLLAFELELNGTRHVATAFGRQQAERRYETAIDDGDSAALLVHNGNGLYTATVANLKPGEDAVIRYRYAELLHAHRNQVRLNLPTVIAPRYGNPADAGLEGPAIPGAELLVEYPFSLRIELAGFTDAARLSSPSHEVTTTATAGGMTVEIGRRGFLDRDFVLLLDHPAALAGTLVAADGEGFVAVASAVLPAGEAERPLIAKFLLDCSGSMGGDSIEAARRALVQILGNLVETDRFSLTRFGSQVQHITAGLEPADAHSIKPVMQLVQRMEADMGGTNMAEAIQATIGIRVPQGSQADLVLITDGEVYSVDKVVETAGRSGHRLFVVAIGAAPNEALARKVSERTGGACDFVAAGERVEPAILRMFGRLRAAPRTVGEIQWSATPDWTAPLPAAVFPNDTMHLMAGFRTRPDAPVAVTINGASERITLMLPAAAHLVAGDVLPRLAAAQRLATLPEDAARDLAIQYQLVSRHTSLVLVAKRSGDDKVKELPRTIAVPHMLAAGWGGSARADFAPMLAAVSRSASMELPAMRADRAAYADLERPAYAFRAPPSIPAVELQDIPAFLQRKPVDSSLEMPEELRIAILAAVVQRLAQRQPLPMTIDELNSLCQLPDRIRLALDCACASARGSEGTEAEFVRALLEYLDRKDGLITFPSTGFMEGRRIRALRRRMTALFPLDNRLSSQPATP